MKFKLPFSILLSSAKSPHEVEGLYALQNAAHALENINDISEGIVNGSLKSFPWNERPQE